MDQITAFVEENERWLYIVLVIVSLWYLREFWRAQHRLHIGAYMLERETASRGRASALAILVLLVSGAGLVYITARHISPNLSTLLSLPMEEEVVTLITAVPRETPEVTLLLPGQPTPTMAGTATPIKQNTLVPPTGVGCDNPLAVIVSPLPGAVLSGTVEVQGTADIPDFAFYVLEISTLGDNWMNVHTHNKPVSSGVLGEWDSNRHPPGEHAFRLVVYNSDGAFLEPCAIPVSIGGAQ